MKKLKHIINKLNISTISSSKSIYNPTSSLEDIRNSMIEYMLIIIYKYGYLFYMEFMFYYF